MHFLLVICYVATKMLISLEKPISFESVTRLFITYFFWAEVLLSPLSAALIVDIMHLRKE